MLVLREIQAKQKEIGMNKNTYEYRINQLATNRKYLENYRVSNPKYVNNKMSIIFPFLEYLEKEKISADKIQIDQIVTYVRTLA
jgi:hypothetical protein